VSDHVEACRKMSRHKVDVEVGRKMSRHKVDVEAGQKCEITGLEHVASHHRFRMSLLV